MHATLLTVMLLAGAQEPGPQEHCGDCRAQPTTAIEDCQCGRCSRGCGDCGPSRGIIRQGLCETGCRAWGMFWGCLATCCGSKPRAYYLPQCGCCPGDGRPIAHYPPFYGSSSHGAYNYRHLFDYPWHPRPLTACGGLDRYW